MCCGRVGMDLRGAVHAEWTATMGRHASEQHHAASQLCSVVHLMYVGSTQVIFLNMANCMPLLLLVALRVNLQL